MVARHHVDLVHLKRTPLPDGLTTRGGGQLASRSRLADWTSTNGRLPNRLTIRWKGIETAVLLPREIQATGADLFLATDPGAVAFSRKFRTAAILYDLVPLRFPEAYLPPWRSAVARAHYAMELHAIKRADHLISISEATRRDAVELLGIPSSRISVAPLAVDPDRFQPRDPEMAHAYVAARYAICQPYFLYIGGFDARKNLPTLIRAYGKIAQDTGALLVMGGTLGRLGERLRSTVQNLPGAESIRWLGYVPDDDLPSLYAGACALTFPSLYEGFGLPVLEAMSCGTPVLTSPISSLPEVAGNAALYARPDSVDEIAAGMRRLALEPELRVELRGRGLERARRFSWTHTAERVLDGCRAVLSA